MSKGKFATVISCIDGRIQKPVIDWVCLRLNVDYADLITEPGADRIIAQGAGELVEAIIEKVRLSVTGHGSTTIVIVGHYDCLANPGSKEDHIQQILTAADTIEGWNLHVRIIGLWANEYGWVDLVCDTKDSLYNRRSIWR